MKNEIKILFKFIKILLYSLKHPVYNEGNYFIYCNNVYLSFFSEYRDYWVKFFTNYDKHFIFNSCSNEVSLYKLKRKK